MTAMDKNALGQEGLQVLQALAQAPGPQAPKQIAQAAGLDGKLVSDVIKGLKSQGLVDSPVRCKYGLTPAGQDAAKG
jgi:predicted transcriptional regulator